MPATSQILLPATLPGPKAKCSGCPERGFTLIELLLVIAIIAILAAFLMPVLTTAQAKGRRTACLNNLKQCAISFQMYSADNDGKLAQNAPLKKGETNSWVLGDMKLTSDSTNLMHIRQGKLFPYASQVALYHCPADPSHTGPTPRVRSYSMNGWIGSRYMETYPRLSGFRTFVRDSELSVAGPSAIWVMADEHEATIDDAWFLVTMDDSHPFASFPASRHEHSYGLAFGDGHAEFCKLRDPRTQSPMSEVTRDNSDWQRLKILTTVR
jgi:prepilin-type N-terminal cleavage/methylation domain-containing protein